MPARLSRQDSGRAFEVFETTQCLAAAPPTVVQRKPSGRDFELFESDDFARMAPLPPPEITDNDKDAYAARPMIDGRKILCALACSER